MRKDEKVVAPTAAALAVSGVVIVVAPKDLPASAASPGDSRTSVQAGLARIPALKAEMEASLGDELALTIREVTHPTGEGGTMGRKSVECTSDSCTASFDVLWKGGFTASAYSSTVWWSVALDLKSTSGIQKETSAVRADASHTAEMQRHLERIAEGWRTRLGGGE